MSGGLVTHSGRAAAIPVKTTEGHFTVVVGKRALRCSGSWSEGDWSPKWLQGHQE